MCFTKEKRSEAPKIAEKNIMGFKVLTSTGTGLHSPIRGGVSWKQKSMRKLKNWETTPSIWSVNRGFHCFRTLEDAENGFTIKPSGNQQVYIVKIPKGAKYYENATQYCSDAMMLENVGPLRRLVIPVKKKVVAVAVKKAAKKTVVKKKK